MPVNLPLIICLSSSQTKVMWQTIPLAKSLHPLSSECFRRQSSVVINIVDADNMSRLPRLVRGFNRCWVGGVGQPSPPHCPVYTPQFVFWWFQPTHPGIRAADGRHWTGGVDTIHSMQLPYVYLPFPFSGNPVYSQYLDILLSSWLGLSLIPISCPISSFMGVASSMTLTKWNSIWLVVWCKGMGHGMALTWPDWRQKEI